jgi:hypothetical protein
MDMKKSLFILLCLISLNGFGQFVRKPVKTNLISYDLRNPAPSTWEDPKVYIGITAVGGTFIVNRFVCKNMTEGQQMLIAVGGAATLYLSYVIFDAIKDHKHKNRYKKCNRRII